MKVKTVLGEKSLKEVDRWTSTKRKQTMSKHSLMTLAETRKKEALATGRWKELDKAAMEKMRRWTKIMCCSWSCGCVGQITRVNKVKITKPYDFPGQKLTRFYHRGHGQHFASTILHSSGAVDHHSAVGADILVRVR